MRIAVLDDWQRGFESLEAAKNLRGPEVVTLSDTVRTPEEIARRREGTALARPVAHESGCGVE